MYRFLISGSAMGTADNSASVYGWYGGEITSSGPAALHDYAVHPYKRFVPPKANTFVEILAKRYGKDYDWTRYESSPDVRRHAPSALVIKNSSQV
jgi:hypothetical protein